VLDLLTDLVAKADGRCAYAEARHVDRRAESLAVRAGDVDEVATSASAGIGVRVRVGGGWGFAATRDASPAGAEAALGRALALAESQPAGPGRPLAPVEPAKGHWASRFERDPFASRSRPSSSSSPRPRRPCARATRGSCAPRRPPARGASARPSPRPRAPRAPRSAWRRARDRGLGGRQRRAQVRSHPLAHGGLFSAAGWEHVEALDLAAHAPRVAEEAIALLTAPPCPEGVTTDRPARRAARAADPRVDRARARARPDPRRRGAYAGTSWVHPDDLGTLRYGSDALDITADATLPAGWARSAGTTRASPARARR
jgi:TldD protein